MINLKNYSSILSIDNTTLEVKCQAGTTIDTLNNVLQDNGMALANLGSISEQTISGAIATGTHGSGYNSGVIATTILELDLITASGEVIQCSRDHHQDIFLAALCSLGALGVVSTVTIQCVPAFFLKAKSQSMTLSDFLSDYDNLAKAEEFVRYHWYPHTNDGVYWKARSAPASLVKDKTTYDKLIAMKDKFIGHYTFEFLLWVSTRFESIIPTVNRKYYKMKKKDYSEEGISFELFNFDCLFKQYVTEWSVPIENTVQAARAIEKLIQDLGINAHFPIEFRFTDADDIYLSPSYGGKRCWIGIIMYRPYGKDVPKVKEYFDAFMEEMHQIDGRPHWAKFHPWNYDDCDRSYPKWRAFCEIRDRLDPDKLFWNDYMEKIFNR
eukprot:TRINITY_DN554_c0_g2_i1.p1 TRINITY_DN554_c0_g2~~TRINITY_DN554_c0_g2_i1.p1  ORF type:complete len:382 (+),score=68.77 TRINITY_DN554_c0_g2_i1:326-1471(+)